MFLNCSFVFILLKYILYHFSLFVKNNTIKSTKFLHFYNITLFSFLLYNFLNKKSPLWGRCEVTFCHFSSHVWNHRLNLLSLVSEYSAGISSQNTSAKNNYFLYLVQGQNKSHNQITNCGWYSEHETENNYFCIPIWVCFLISL